MMWINITIYSKFSCNILLHLYIDKFKELPKSYDDIEKYQLRTLMNTYIFYKYIKLFVEGHRL